MGNVVRDGGLTVNVDVCFFFSCNSILILFLPVEEQKSQINTKETQRVAQKSRLREAAAAAAAAAGWRRFIVAVHIYKNLNVYIEA